MFLPRISRPNALRFFSRPTQLANFSDEKKPPLSDETAKKSDTKSKDDTTKSESAAERLNRLLSSMNTDENFVLKKSMKIPQAGARKQKLAEAKAKKAEAGPKKPQNIVQAAKEVADMMGDKTRQTEAELLSKLLNHIDDGAGKGATENPDGQSLSDLIGRMKVDRSKPDRGATQTRSDIVRKAVDSRRSQQQYQSSEESQQSRPRYRRPQKIQPVPSSGRINLFGERLNIFTEPEKLRESPDMLETWNRLHKRELKLAIAHPPSNYFEKMILWTEQGKIWKFPIDNEQGLDEEARVDFTEHVFLEQYLEGWCPEKGPVRHFMELVCVGLSQNPYVTAKDKKEHILWYRDYFENKKDILREVIEQQKSDGGKTQHLEK